jgi:glycosyltransferase involved in cell wall biosynthesis
VPTPGERRLRILYLEPYDAGSHAAFTRTLTTEIDADWTVLTLPGRHWKWRARGSAAWFALEHAAEVAAAHDLLFASAYLPLAELLGLVPALARLPRVLFFHENQLTFPVREEWSGERDLHFGFTQLVSALAATRCVFSSAWNRDSFLDAARELLARLPDAVPRGWVERVAERSVVLPLPLDLPDLPGCRGEDVPPGAARAAGPMVLWNHRWEHDKAPEPFFAALDRLVERDVPFRVAICGERFGEAPAIFEEARARLGGRVVHFGWVPSREEYFRILSGAQLAVSTARHEFFGVAMLEAVQLGARPLVPDRLAYREVYPAVYRYADDATLPEELERLCSSWTAGKLDLRADRRTVTERFHAAVVLPRYGALFEELAAAGCADSRRGTHSA